MKGDYPLDFHGQAQGRVGWDERSESQHPTDHKNVGFRKLNPTYILSRMTERQPTQTIGYKQLHLYVFLNFAMNLRFDRLLSLLSAGTLLLVSLTSHAAGFDCAKATSATEKAICTDNTLSRLDYLLFFAWTRASGIDPVAMKASQLQWLKQRDACGADTSCLSARYKERLAVLVNIPLPVDADQAGNRQEGLIPENPEELTNANAKRCTADKRFCFQVSHNSTYYPPLLQIDYAGAPSSPYCLTLSPDPENAENDFTVTPCSQDMIEDGVQQDPDDSVTLWSHVLRLAGDNGSILVGVMYKVSTMYSGGGGSATELHLFRLSWNEDTFRAHQVLSVPISGSLMIRACFSEQDMSDRLGACHDEYSFSASIWLDQTVKSGFPRLVYQTDATGFPGKVSRDQDSTIMPPLREQDLVMAEDPHCTYKRTFRLENTTGVYVPDQPLPDCSNYTVP
ncbi:MAG: hypothetical protein LBE22_11245 [Azoarcus sp.]|jgi:hypothetical protein|nr:hypothetical protein [Azoarcus sp.]